MRRTFQTYKQTESNGIFSHEIQLRILFLGGGGGGGRVL